MNRTKALLMALVLAIGCAYVWSDLRQKSRETEKVEVDGRSVFPELLTEDIAQVRISHSEGAFEINRLVPDAAKKGGSTGKIWVLGSPKGAPTSRAEVAEILQSIVELRVYGEVSDEDYGDGLELFGLDEPTLEIAFSKNSGSSYKLFFGKEYALGGKRYVKMDPGEGEILLVDDSNFRQLYKTKDEVRNYRPAAFAVKRVSECVVHKDEKEALHLVKQKESSEWMFVHGGEEKFAADRKVVSRLLEDLSNLSAKRFIDGRSGNASAYGLDRPMIRVNLSFYPPDEESRGKSEVRGELSLLLGEKRTLGQGSEGAVQFFREYYLQLADDPWIYGLGTRLPSDLLKTARHFRDRTPFDRVNSSRIGKIHFERKEPEGENFVLSKAEKEDEKELWSLAVNGEDQGLAKQAHVEDWLDKLLNLELLSFSVIADDVVAEEGLTDTILEIRFELDSGTSSVEKHYFAVGKALQALSFGDGRASDASTAPRYVAFGPEGESKIRALMSSAVFDEVNKRASYFQASSG